MHCYETLKMGNVIKYIIPNACCGLHCRHFDICTNMTDCIKIDLVLPMESDLTVVSFILAVNNHSSGWLNFKNKATICRLL